MKLVEVKNVSKIYGFGEATTVALDNVSLTIDKGDFLAIMGPSGSGKSTLMHLIGLLDHPTSGDIAIEGVEMIEQSEKRLAKLRRNKIGFVFQSFNLLPRLRAIDNVALPLTYSGLSTVKRLKRAEEMLESVGLADRQYYMSNQLSGGQVQRVAIARALVNNPTIILADEPTGNLDSVASKSLMKLLENLHKKGHTIIMVTHDPQVASYAKRVVHMLDGKLDSDTRGTDAPKPKPPETAKKPTKRKAAKKRVKKPAKKSKAKGAKK
jgi:putative ABC transport system ATP-binding protein